MIYVVLVMYCCMFLIKKKKVYPQKKTDEPPLMSNIHKRIRFVNSDGPLVPMVRLVPIENDVIPMVLLVNMHLINGTLIFFPCDLAGYRAIPMVYWYQ